MDFGTTTPVPGSKTHFIFKWVLILGIVIVTNLFLNYAIDVFYDEPVWDDFCKQEQVQPLIKTQNECVAKGGQWTGTIPQRETVSGKPIPVDEQIGGYCNLFFTCQNDFDDVHKVYNRNVFIILVAAGVLLIIGSYFVASAGAVSLGFSLAGIVSLIIGAIRYWSDMDDRLRVIVLGFALIALVWFGIKKFRE